MLNPDHDSWAPFHDAALGIPAMLQVALGNRTDAIRIARVLRQLYADAVAELGEREAEDVMGAP